ncbi:MAG: tyrosine--tRNA ligase [Gemmatimonadota bacterium]
MAHLLDTLRARGMVHDVTPALAERLTAGPITAYIGFDPTASSLHVGNLVPVMALAWLQRLGGRPIALIGGGTGLVGDPSGKRSERPMLSAETVRANADALRTQLGRFLDFEQGPTSAAMVDNTEWLGGLGLLAFLRDAGKHFTVSYMLQKDTVKSRLDSGISFTEFSYMLIQAYDFAHLAGSHQAELQMGGSDQWGNITAGIELASRRDGRKLHGLVLPLLTTAAGAKFGKSEDGNVWLDADRTSPYQFHQFWLRTDDADVERLLRFFTFLPLEDITELMDRHGRDPSSRTAQRALADDVTHRIHGGDALRRATLAGAILFGTGDVELADAETRRMVQSEVPEAFVSTAELAEGLPVIEAFTRTGLADSKKQARQFAGTGSLRVGGSVVEGADRITAAQFGEHDVIFLRRGKRQWAALRRGEAPTDT